MECKSGGKLTEPASTDSQGRFMAAARQAFPLRPDTDALSVEEKDPPLLIAENAQEHSAVNLQ
jgi:hypothetical protein